MKPLRPRMLTLLAMAADLRAGGASWATVAQNVQRSASTCREWPRLYPADWRRLYREAEDQFLSGAGAEGLFILRELLRSKNEKIRLGVGQCLLKARMDQRAREDQAEREAGGRLEQGIAELAGLAKDLTDAQLIVLIENCLARRGLAVADAAGGGSSPAGPAPAG